MTKNVQSESVGISTPTHAKSAAEVSPALWNVALVVSASLFVALCARITMPLPFTPVPLTLQNFAVLLVGLALGPRRAFAALALYLAEGAAGLPVFNPLGLGGIAQLLGPTGGFLLAYPLVAAVAGYIGGLRQRRFDYALAGAAVAESLLFLCGVSWFMLVTHLGADRAVQFALYPFLFAEVIKTMTAAALAPRLMRVTGKRS
jgi:biotin transport system substrate-specific component